jgi:hypothetical protein
MCHVQQSTWPSLAAWNSLGARCTASCTDKQQQHHHHQRGLAIPFGDHAWRVSVHQTESAPAYLSGAWHSVFMDHRLTPHLHSPLFSHPPSLTVQCCMSES